MLDEEIGCADVDGEKIVEIRNCRVLDRRGPGEAGIGDEDVQAIAHDGSDLLGELVRAVRRSQVGGDAIGAAAGLADVGDGHLSFFRAAAVMHENLRSGLGESEGSGAADATRGTGDKGGLS